MAMFKDAVENLEEISASMNKTQQWLQHGNSLLSDNLILFLPYIGREVYIPLTNSLALFLSNFNHQVGSCMFQLIVEETPTIEQEYYVNFKLAVNNVVKVSEDLYYVTSKDTTRVISDGILPLDSNCTCCSIQLYL